MRRAYLFILLGLSFLGCADEKRINVGIQPYEDVDHSITDTISNTLKTSFGVNTYILPVKPLPEQAFINVKSPRYRADKIISIIRKEKPDTLDYVLALTNKDISTTKKDRSGNTKNPAEKYSDWGIFGLGYRPGPTCVVSTFRLGGSGDKFLTRLKKVAIHEFGHNLGLPHCEEKLCVMRDAVETIKTIDLVDPELCGNCKAKINDNQSIKN